jgi:hypothetical protein
MTTLLRMVIGAAAAVITTSVVVPASLTQSVPSPTAVRTHALRTFGERMTAYSELHRRAAASMSRLKPTADLNTIRQRQADLWGAIVMARPKARQGGIFDPPVAAAFHGLIAEALTALDSAVMLRAGSETSEKAPGYRLHVNTSCSEEPTRELPSALRAALPALPEGIVYRLIDMDLLLWDIDADLIIHVLPDALPRAGS